MVAVLGGAVQFPSASALPSPGLNCQLTGLPLPAPVRYIPEPDQTNDFVGYFEAKQCFEAMNKAFPDRMELRSIGKSYGLSNAQTQQVEKLDVMLVEITNEKSPIPFEKKAKVVLMLSIHGNEKGGREGGFRVQEDLVRNLDTARLPVVGHPGKTLYDLLDYSVLVLLYPNPDGWATDEPGYTRACVAAGGLYKRENGHCADLNRQLPTKGWQFINAEQGRLPMNEPEQIATANYLSKYTNVAYAADIHGMLNPADGRVGGAGLFGDQAAPTGDTVNGHFILGLIGAGRMTPLEMLQSTKAAELLDKRLNNNPVMAGWNTLPATGVWGGEFYSWSTVWDTIGYTDSGISGDWFLQDSGLNAPGIGFEMAYNHLTFDSVYPGAAQAMNVYHVETVRQIARTYLESAVTDVQTSVEMNGKSTAYLYNPKIVTSEGDSALAGWAQRNANDDPWDYAHRPYAAAPIDYLRDLKPFVRNGDAPAVFDELRSTDVTTARLADYDNFIVAGSSVDQIKDDAAAVAALQAWVAAGGNLVLTDQSMTLLASIGAVPPTVIGSYGKYAGMTLLVDREHPLAANSVKLSRQTYETVPIGIPIGNRNTGNGPAPVWWVNATAAPSARIEAVGTVPPTGSTNTNGNINLGRLKLGEGTVNFLGALLPDPTQEYYHPYGLESYATTYFGNLLFYNMLGAEQTFVAPPIVLENVGQVRVPLPPSLPDAPLGAGDASGTPGFEAALAVVAFVGALAIGFGRRRA